MKQIKILIEMKHGLGDCVCMLPAVKAVRERYPDAYIALLVDGKPNEEIFRNSQIKIDEYIYFSLKKYPKLHTIRTLLKLFFKGFDIGILALMTPEKKGKYLFKLLRIKECYGEQFEGYKFLDLDDKMHFVDRNLAVVNPIVENNLDKQPHLFADPIYELRYISLLENISGNKVAVNIGGADKNCYKGRYGFTRNWKKESMHELVAKLANLPRCNIFLLGGSLEADLIKDYKDILEHKNVFNFVNKTTIGETIYLIQQCDCSVGVDTGMQHVADALGKPTVSIFGPTNPKTHGAYSDKAIFVQCHPKISCQYCYGSDVELYHTCPNRKCLNTISVDSVLQKVKELLTETKF